MLTYARLGPDAVRSGLYHPRLVTHVAQRVRIVGFPIAAQSFEAAISQLLEWATGESCQTVHFCNVHLLVEGRQRADVGAALRGSSMLLSDGMPLVWLARVAGVPSERIAGPDAMPALIAAGVERGLRHYFYGSTPAVLERLVASVAQDHPGAIVAGTFAPPFGPQEDAAMQADVDRINAARADVLWVGLGAPKQDLWIEQNRDRLDVGVALAVGAAFDFGAGTVQRAPAVLRGVGLEWAFRLAVEPRRLLRRYAVTNIAFLYLVLRSRRLRRPSAADAPR